MHIALGTASALKKRALEKALSRQNISADITVCEVSSDVSAQPFGFEETLLGARNRILHTQEKSDANVYAAIENGIIEIGEEYVDLAVVILRTSDKEYLATSAGYHVPKEVVNEIKEQRTELGHITQRLSGDSDKDPIRYFSGGIVKREELLEDAIVIALAQMSNDRNL